MERWACERSSEYPAQSLMPRASFNMQPLGASTAASGSRWVQAPACSRAARTLLWLLHVVWAAEEEPRVQAGLMVRQLINDGPRQPAEVGAAEEPSAAAVGAERRLARRPSSDRKQHAGLAAARARTGAAPWAGLRRRRCRGPRWGSREPRRSAAVGAPAAKAAAAAPSGARRALRRRAGGPWRPLDTRSSINHGVGRPLTHKRGCRAKSSGLRRTWRAPA